MPTAITECPERLYSLRVLSETGYGSRRTNLDLINAGLLPAVKVGNSYKIRERDLPLIAVPVAPTPATESGS